MASVIATSIKGYKWLFRMKLREFETLKYSSRIRAAEISGSPVLSADSMLAQMPVEYLYIRRVEITQIPARPGYSKWLTSMGTRN